MAKTLRPLTPLPPTQIEGGLAARVRRIVFHPAAERLRLDTETMTSRGLYLGWILPLAAIGPIAALIRTFVFPMTYLGVVVRVAPLLAIEATLALYALTVAMTFVLALAIDAFAPSFDGHRSRVQATKTAAFALTPAWVAGVFQLLPSIGLAGLIGLIAALYGLYLLYLAVPTLMKPPAAKALPYGAVAIVVAVVAIILVRALAVGLVVTIG